MFAEFEEVSLTRDETRKLVILGAGHGCLEALAIIQRLIATGKELTVVGILDDNPDLHAKLVGGYEVMGPLENWRTFDASHFFVHSIGTFTSRLARREIVIRSEIPLNRFEKLIDPGAVILVDTNYIGAGSIIHAGAVVSVGAKIGNFVVVSANTVVGVSNLVGSYALFASGISTSTNVKVGCMAFIGSGVSVAPDLELDALSFVAVGTVVLGDVGAGYSVIGNPGRSFERIDVPSEISKMWEIERASEINL